MSLESARVTFKDRLPIDLFATRHLDIQTLRPVASVYDRDSAIWAE
ncbi:MAG: hypothetical protein GY934_25080 [Gammaproteobacteria bacterium]|nr:hypothetical protein [Gammaproteobacteria bacterium]